jgi:hypothetical protein
METDTTNVNEDTIVSTLDIDDHEENIAYSAMPQIDAVPEETLSGDENVDEAEITDNIESEYPDRASEMLAAFSREDIDRIVSSQLRSLEREYCFTIEASQQGLANRNQNSSSVQRVSSAHIPMMELSPGSTEFPDDYDNLQAEDDLRLHRELKAVKEREKVIQEKALETVDFDPFQQEQTSNSSPVIRPLGKDVPKRKPRSLSPIKPSVREAILNAMKSIKIQPKGVSMFADRIVASHIKKNQKH